MTFSPSLAALESVPNDWGVCERHHLLEMCQGVEKRNRHCKYTCRIVKRSGRRFAEIRVELKAKWRTPTTAGGIQITSFVHQLVSDQWPKVSFRVSEELNGNSIQVQLRKEERRESLIIEEAQFRGLDVATQREIVKWADSKLASPDFGSAPNIKTLARNETCHGRE